MYYSRFKISKNKMLKLILTIVNFHHIQRHKQSVSDSFLFWVTLFCPLKVLVAVVYNIMFRLRASIEVKISKTPLITYHDTRKVEILLKLLKSLSISAQVDNDSRNYGGESEKRRERG